MGLIRVIGATLLIVATLPFVFSHLTKPELELLSTHDQLLGSSSVYREIYEHGMIETEFIARLRKLSGGKPVGFKLCLGHPWEFMGVVKAMRETGIVPDFIVVDGAEGGTGASPLEFSNHIGVPLREGLLFAHNTLVGAGLRERVEQARREAEAAFGDGRVYIERFLERPRHIEIQVLGDSQGNVIHLGERDCSCQRRHQKLLEEAPSPGITDELRQRMGEAAIRGAARIGYLGAGTMEFLVTEGGEYFFMEMNTRIQVEHPVTEMVTGQDLVLRQLMIAAGEALDLRQDQVRFRGHAIECRINAEDPTRNFMPTPGRIVTFHQPGGPGVRVDTAAYQSYVIPPYYDSLVAKVLTHGTDRAQAIARMRVALDEFVVEGIATTIPLHRKLIQEPRFLAGEVHTRFVEEWLDEDVPPELLTFAHAP